MRDLLVYLQALYFTAKDLHYNAKGVDFYSIHKLADEFTDGIFDFIDEIKERCYLGCGMDAPLDIELMDDIKANLIESRDVDMLFGQVSKLIDLIIYQVEQVKRSELLAGEQAIVDEISSDMLFKKMLISRTLM